MAVEIIISESQIYSGLLLLIISWQGLRLEVVLVEAALQSLFVVLHVALLRGLDLHGRVVDLEVLLQKLGDII